MEDQIILVDIDDNEIGTAKKLEAHRKNMLHRAFSVFLYGYVDNKLSMLVQKRAEHKYHSGGLWTNACCSHPRKNESLEQAVERRLYEELGIKTDVKELFSFTYYHRFTQECAEFEYDHVFLGEYSSKNIKFNTYEIASVKWVSVEELKGSIQSDPEMYTPWFLIAVPKVIKIIESGKL